MQRKHSYRPTLDPLELRLAPAIAITTPLNLNGDTDLVITSIAGPATSTLSVVGGIDQFGFPSVDTYVVQENGGPLVDFGPITGNVIMNLNAFPGSLNPAGVAVSFELLNGEELEGDLRIIFASTQGGDHDIQINGSAGIFGSGAIIGGPPANPGNVVVTTGTGDDVILLFLFGPNDVNGSVAISTGAGDDQVLHFGGTIANHFTLTNVNQFGTGFGGVTLVEGNLSYSNLTDATNVVGNVFVDGDTIVEGNVTIQTNARADNVTLDGNVFGNATIRTGGGVNTFTMGATALVNANLSYTGGNQRDVVILGPATAVMGNATFNLGSSGSTSPLANVLDLTGAMWGNSILINGGNGRDEVSFDSFAQGAYLRVYLNSGNDDMTLGTATVLNRAYVDGGFGTDILTSLLPVFIFPIRLLRFP